MPKIYDENGIATEIDDSIYYSLDDLPGEEWKDIFYLRKRKQEVIDLRGVYQVSNRGRVKSLLRHDRFGRLLMEKIIACGCGKGDVVDLSFNGKGIQVSVMGLLRDYFSTQDYVRVSPNRVFKKVICVTTGKEYNSVRGASRETGVDPGLISEVCRHKRPYAGRLVDGKIISDSRKYINQGIPLVWRYWEDVVYEG